MSFALFTKFFIYTLAIVFSYQLPGLTQTNVLKHIGCLTNT